MSAVISIELLLDAESEARVRTDWNRLAAAGHSSMAAHTSASNRPHVTLARRLRVDARDAAIGLLGAPHTGAGVALRRWDAATRSVTVIR